MKKVYTSRQSSLFIIFFLFNLTALPLFPQAKRYKIYDEYIERYKHIAIDHMQRHKIPASITLAQGLLESGAGKSELATKGKNHFGIKCHSDWNGKKMHKADDGPNDCFRVYNSVEASYEDHAQFLKRTRYQSLYNLKITDYRGWAKGLQQCGYATDRAYANKLIKVIEDYELYLHDQAALGKKVKGSGNVSRDKAPVVQLYKHTPYKTHNLVYVIAKDGDTYEAIAAEFDFKVKDLCKWNEVPEDFPLKEGDLVYFEKKKSKADKPYYDHVVQIGESMHSIAQKYGVRVKNLYKMNKKDFEYVPVEGDVLKLR